MQRVVIIGMGGIGFGCARAVRAESGVKLVGMVDSDPQKLGKSLAELGWRPTTAGEKPPADEPGAIPVAGAPDDPTGDGADVAIITTSSDFAKVAPLVREALARGLHVISSCEQMIWPWYRHASLADQIDAEAQRVGRAVLGTGVNPGYIMDVLAVSLSSMVRRVTGVICERRVDASTRRRALQEKIGATLHPDAFEDLAQANNIGHEGLPESVALLGAGLGQHVAPASVKVTLAPTLADKPTESLLGLIHPGYVTGIHHKAHWESKALTIDLDLTMAVGLESPRDVIRINGPVSLHLKIGGALPGDSATVATLLNHVRVIDRVAPGLRTMLDMPVAGCRGHDASV